MLVSQTIHQILSMCRCWWQIEKKKKLKMQTLQLPYMKSWNYKCQNSNSICLCLKIFPCQLFQITTDILQAILDFIYTLWTSVKIICPTHLTFCSQYRPTFFSMFIEKCLQSLALWGSHLALIKLIFSKIFISDENFSQTVLLIACVTTFLSTSIRSHRAPYFLEKNAKLIWGWRTLVQSIHHFIK